jgi:hypothetical protein
MIAEQYLTGSRLFRRLRNGPHGSYVELYASRLVKVGLSHRGTWRSLNLAGDLLSWLTRIGSIPSDLNERMVEDYLRHRSTEQCTQKGDSRRLMGCPQLQGPHPTTSPWVGRPRCASQQNWLPMGGFGSEPD